MRYNFWRFLVLIGALLFGCDNPTEQSDKGTKTKSKTPVVSDSGYVIVYTKTLITCSANQKFSAKDRKNTQFDLDKSSMLEKEEAFKIKFSDSRIMICDINDQVLKDLIIVKKWIDESGPSTVYDLKDKDGVEYSLDHYVDIEKKNFLAFRFNTHLQTYVD